MENSQITFERILLHTIYIGALLGVFFALVEFIFKKSAIKRLSLWLQILIKSAVYFVILVTLLTIARILVLYDGNESFSIERWWWIQNNFFRTTIFYFLFALIIFSFLKIANQKFGSGIFVKMLLGTYKKPQEVERIFMFMDLTSSTTIAENLGNYKYSQFMQDIFFELNEIISKYRAAIYQYVGDEAVLVWSMKNGLQNNNCVEVFFNFKERLGAKKNYFLNKYGFHPEFKAGVHGGTIIFAEIGTIRKELAYHGDVINTSARIQSLCSQNKQELLISATIWNSLDVIKSYKSQLYTDVFLKGKDETFTLFGVQN
tara:strand:+ start:14049 stop:14996 length:948 start_codon:yes stop_codon:yes gene_type:complete